MIGKYHTSITNEALGDKLNGYAVNYVDKGNTDSDQLRNKIAGISDGYDLSAQHFNKTSLENCEKFLKDAQEVVVDDFIQAANSNGDDEYYEQAFYDLGRLVHNIQDFYSHTNWINYNSDELWNEDVKKPNLEKNQELKTGNYTAFSQYIDEINPFYVYDLSSNYDLYYESDADMSHYGLNKDEPDTIADRLYEEKYGVSGFTKAADLARAHTLKKWEDVDAILQEELDEDVYENMVDEISNFNSTQENFDENIDKYRENFNSDMKELK